LFVVVVHLSGERDAPLMRAIYSIELLEATTTVQFRIDVPKYADYSSTFVEEVAADWPETLVTQSH